MCCYTMLMITFRPILKKVFVWSLKSNRLTNNVYKIIKLK